MSDIGFLNILKQHQRYNQEYKNQKIYTFDSGYSINVQDAKLHTLIFGTTGTGKTHSIFLPMLAGFLQTGNGGLIIDVKGNLREQSRALAKAVSREKDIYEFGLSDTAIPLNIIENMDVSEVSHFFELLFDNSIDNSTHNKDFHMRGLLQCVQVLQILRLYHEKNKMPAPTLFDMCELLINAHSGSTVYEEYKEKFYDSNVLYEKRLVDSIESDAFHILHFNNKKISLGRGYNEQLNYAINGPRTAFIDILNTRNIKEKFANSEGVGLNYKNLFFNRSVVVLRFDAGSGKIGSFFSRHFITEYYKTVFSMNIDEIKDYPSFIAIDEFHEVARLSNKAKFSDTAFVAQAREFGASFIASTQSAASLMLNGNDEEAVLSFVSNCNSKIYLRSDDPLTQNITNVYDPEVALFKLDHGKVFTTLYSDTDKKLRVACDHVNKSYVATQELLKDRENQIAKETILENNATLLALLRRERRREKITAQRTHKTLDSLKNTKPEICKIYDTHDPLECKMQIHAFIGKHIDFFEDEEALKVYVPLSWREAIVEAFDRFADGGGVISIKSVGYDGVNNVLCVCAFEEVREEKKAIAQNSQDLLNKYIADALNVHRKLVV